MSAPDLCRKHGISDATFYNWQRKYGGMEVASAKRLKTHEAEEDVGRADDGMSHWNAMVRETMADAALKEMLRKNF